MLNPIYLPQLVFRTPLAMVTAGLFALFLTYFFTRGAAELRAPGRSAGSRPGCWSGCRWAAGRFWYWQAVPGGCSTTCRSP